VGVLPAAGNNPDEGTGVGYGALDGPIDRTGFFENIGAGYRAAQAGPGSTRSRQNAVEAELYDQVIRALAAEGELGADKIAVRPGGFGYRGPKDIPVNQYGVGFIDKKRPFRNPYTDRPSLSQQDNPVARLYLGGDGEEKAAIWAAVARVRLRKPDFLKDLADERALVGRAETRRKQRLASAEEVMSRGSTGGKIGSFVGGVVGSIAAGDPENFVGAGVGGAAGKTLGRTIIRRALEEGAVNAAAGLVAAPAQAIDAERLDREMTAGDVAQSVAEQGAIGFLFGVAGASAGPVAGKAKEALGTVAGKVADKSMAIPAVRDAVVAASIRAGTVADRDMLGAYRQLHNPYGAYETATPDERAAMNVVERDVETKETSPFHPDDDPEHEGRLDAIAKSLGMEPPPLRTSTPVQTPTVPDRTSSEAPRRAASYDEAVHRAEGTGKNPDSSANGHFQFINSTWLEYAPRVTDTKGMSKGQILALRQDRKIAERAERLFRADNARYLMERGVDDSPGNLSLAHFLGKRDAARVLRASPDTPIAQVVDADSIAANKPVFNGRKSKIRTAGDMVAWAHRRIGATVDSAPARPDAVPEFDPADAADYEAPVPYRREAYRPDEIETDAALMQYKSGGDAAGVTGKLNEVTAWNPIMSSEILVWERNDGSRVVIDGHQRTGLAKRLYADDPSIELPALVVREADGITAEKARVLGALRNINLGTGSLLDNARVLRDAPEAAGLIKGAENRRDIEGLARLSHEAFGAALNDVIDPAIAAQIGRDAGNVPDRHAAMVDLLVKNRISNAAEAGRIVRQAQADGFGRPDAEQFSMFGEAPSESLYVPIARILAAAEKKLRDERRTFKTLADKAGRIEGAGNRLDRKANQGKVVSSEEALAILGATAHRSGPVRDALIAAARAELSGARRGDAVGQFLDALGAIDLRAAARGVEGDGALREPLGEAGSGDTVPAEAGGVPDSLEPSLFEQALDAATKGERFSDPLGEGAREQIALLEHDLKMDAAPAASIADRNAQETQLRADSPLRPGNVDAEGTMGLGLFDITEQPTFRLSEEGEARPIADILKDAEADETAVANARACLKPGGNE